MDCGPPPLLDNGSFDPPQTTTLGGVVTYQCNEGYVFTEDSAMTQACLESGWSNEDIKCGVFPYVDIVLLNFLYSFSPFIM